LDGIEFIDLGILELHQQDIQQRFETDFAISASLGQIWTISSWVSRNGVFPGGTAGLGFQQRNASGVYLSEFTGPNVFVDTGFTRKQYTTTTNAATIAFVRPYLALQNLLIGQSYDFTIRIGLPQMELGSVATSVIKTTNSAQTRNADVITKTGLGSVLPQTEGWVYAEVDWRQLSLSGAIFSASQLSSETVVNNVNGIRVFRGAGNGLTINIGDGTNVENQSGNIIVNGKRKTLIYFSPSLIKVFLDGSVYLSYSPATFFTVADAFSLGSRVVTNVRGAFFNDPIHSYAIGSGAITDASAIQLTTL
jgi:hypothetical protein